MIDYKITRAREKDIDDMERLLYELFTLESDFSPEPEKQKTGLEILISKEEAIILVAKYNNKVIGMCSVQLLISTCDGAPKAIIEDVIIKKEFRGKGIGTNLLQEAEKWCREKNVLRMCLNADNANNEAINFYKKNQWNITKLVPLHKSL